METRSPYNTIEEFASADGKPISRVALAEQLERLLESRHFRNSKRYPAFLRFVVEHTLASDTDSLKERILGIEVFGRPSDYDTNADPVVRVTAGEVRKRIAQYYQEAGHEHEIRIDLPLGAYVPHFFSVGEPLDVVDLHAAPLPAESLAPSPVPEEQVSTAQTVSLLVEPLAVPLAPAYAVLPPTKRVRSRLAFAMTALVLALLASVLAGWSLWRARKAEPGLKAIWGPIMNSPAPVLNVIGVHTLDRLGNEMLPGSHAGGAGEPTDMLSAMVRSDMVPVSDIVSDSRVTDLLTRHSRPYSTLGSADATLDQVRGGPLVLVGGLDNIWTLRLTSKLRFRFYASTQSESSIVDGEHPEKRWTFNNLQKPVGSAEDYAIVASYFDTTIDQPVVVLAGIGKAGTLVASEFATSDLELRSWLREAQPAGGRNVEMVLATEILDGKAGPPRVVASVAW